MATARIPLTFASATVAAPGTTVGPSLPVPDNCTGLSITNTGSFPALYATGTPGSGALSIGTAGYIASGASVTLPIGSIRARGVIDQAQLAGSGLIFDSIGGGTVLSITYLNLLGTTE